MFVITRKTSNGKEWFSSDGTRNFWQFHGSYWENLFNSKYFKLFVTAEEGYKYLNEVVKFQYLDNCAYALEEVKMDNPLFVITKTPTKAIAGGKDKITNMKTAAGKQYLKKNGSSCYFEDNFDGEFTRKFTSKSKANEVAQNIRAHTLIGQYTIAVEEIS